MASSSTDSWLLSLNMDDLQAECKARPRSGTVGRVPTYIRNLKPRNYDPVILPMGMYNRDFIKKTPMDQLKLEIVSTFLGHLQIGHNRWTEFCREVADAKGQFSVPGVPGLEHFYQDIDDCRPSFLTPELQLSVLIIDAFFIVAVLILFSENELGTIWDLETELLTKHISEIFDRRDVACHVKTFILDIFWLYEGQVPLFLVENVWAKVVPSSGADHEDQSRGFDSMITRCLSEVLSGSGFVYRGDVNVQYSKCEYLLACLHRGLCTGTRPLMDNDSGTRPMLDNDTITGRFKTLSYIRKVPVVMQNFTELMAYTVSRVRGRYPSGTREVSIPSTRTLPSATSLRKTGIRFRGVETTIGDIRFVKSLFHFTATVYLPKMSFHNYSERMLLNLCVYENMNIGTMSPCLVISFVLLLDALIDSEEDVDLLMRGNHSVVVGNFLGDNKELANIFANMLQNFSGVEDHRFTRLRTEMITWYDVRWRRHLIGFLDRFAIAPWLWVSLTAATILLVLTLLQTIYTMWGFYKQY